MEFKIIVDKILFITLIVLILFLNIYSMREICVGDFTRDTLIYYPPPFKIYNVIYVYDLVKDSVERIELIGLILGFNRNIDVNEVVSIKSSGIDIYVLIISISIITTYMKIVKSSKSWILFITNNVFVFTIVILLYLYSYLFNTPLIYGSFVELSRTIDCKRISSLLNTCLIDSFNTDTLIFLKTNTSVIIEFMRDNTVVDRVLVKSNEYYFKNIRTNDEYKLIVSAIDQRLNITYRRVSFINTREYSLTLILSYLPLIFLFITIFVNSFLYKPT
ncbi:MAG: hypothetical protein QXU89_05730 [Desulfurococcaceae archaeon]